MPATYEPIASVTLGSAAASHTFSSIPGTFTDLVLVSYCNGSTGAGSFVVRLNSDTGNNYSFTRLLGFASGVISDRVANRSYADFGSFGGPVGTPNASVTTIMSYANANVNKTILSAAGNGTDYVTRWVSLWRSTSAVTSVTILTDTVANLTSGSTFSLYGIKAA